MEAFKIKDTETALRIIDKFDKVGFEVTKESLKTELGVDENSAVKMLGILDKQVPVADAEDFLNNISLENDLIKEGKAELLEVVKYLKDVKVKSGKFIFNPRVARGLDYYTGSVYETTIDGLEKYGSVCSGGRYADLAGKFINKKLPGVGVSIGLTRLLDVMKNEKLAKFEKNTLTNLVIGLLDEQQRLEANKIAEKIRERGINVEVFYSGSVALGKQIQYKVKKGIEHFLIINKDSTFTMKVSETKEEKIASFDELLKYLDNVC